MNPYKPKTFDLPTPEDISEKTMATHLKLYEGYVKQVNVILEKTEEYAKDSEKNTYVLGELQRRFAFEFDGMRNHEYYFGALEVSPAPLQEENPLAKAISDTWGSVDAFMSRFKAIALTRGIGWAMLSYDHETDRLLTHWVDEQHLGHLTGTCPVLALDVWEHAYILDYAPADKAKYVEAYLKNLNWKKIEENYTRALTLTSQKAS
ncbi:MAG: Fe-Mn family superoxide dismutase [Patescibacteria group bacterium]